MDQPTTYSVWIAENGMCFGVTVWRMNQAKSRWSATAALHVVPKMQAIAPQYPMPPNKCDKDKNAKV
jgi:hypothetical protein